MRSIIVLTGLLIGLVPFLSEGPVAAQKKTPASKLFYVKCTTCHGAEESLKRRATKEQFLVMIRTMQFGAKVTDQEIEQIAAFLGDPSRLLFEQKCTRCHDMNRSRQDSLERKPDAKLKVLVEKMRKKNAAGISEQDAAAIYQYLITFY
jgi:arsenate reductase-like glutaredoxin family protein